MYNTIEETGRNMVGGGALTAHPPTPHKEQETKPQKTWGTVCNTSNKPTGLILGKLLMTQS
jgi:hypothetical protein